MMYGFECVSADERWSWEACWRVYVTSVVDPELFAGSGSGVGSGINHFGSGSGQSGSGMNLIPNFSVKKSHFLNQIAQKI
jgi:hypothetical protein